MRLCLMIEGQEDVTWDDWLALAHACERHGFEALFRSDHYLSVAGAHDRGSLDAWTTLAGLAAATESVRLGTLVSPATFRHPAVLAKSAVTVDHISGGRVEVGMGAGWMEAEHERFGFPFAATRERMGVFAEQLELVHRQWEHGPFDFHGEHYTFRSADPRPKPLQRPHPPLIVGGSGGPRSIGLAARWADEYNTPFATAEECRALRARLDEAGELEQREQPLRLSVMTGFLLGADNAELRDRAERVVARRGEGESSGWIVGSPDDAIRALTELAQSGVERVMLQHLLHEDLETVALLGTRVAPLVA